MADMTTLPYGGSLSASRSTVTLPQRASVSPSSFHSPKTVTSVSLEQRCPIGTTPQGDCGQQQFIASQQFYVDTDLKIRDSSEEIACARELLTLGQNTVKREQLVLNPVTSSKIVSNPAGQRVIVSVPSLKTQNTPRSHSGLNLDGNISESSDSEDESNHVSKILSLSRVILRRNSGPKSTVEDSRCSPAVLKKPNKKLFSWSKKNLNGKPKAKDFIPSYNGLMEGGSPPSIDTNLRPCKVTLPRLSVEDRGLCPGALRDMPGGPINEAQGKDAHSDCPSEAGALNPSYQINTLHPSEPSQCGVDNSCDIMINSNMGDAMTSSSHSFHPQQTTYINSSMSQFGTSTMSTVTSQVMAMPLAQPPVLVFSANSNNLNNAGPVVASGGLPTNLVFSSFPGSAMQMAAIPISKGILGVGGPQAINIQPTDVIKVPVALNSGGVMLAPNPAVGGCVVTLAQPQQGLQNGQPTLSINQSMNGGMISAVPHLPSSSIALPSFSGMHPPQTQVSDSSCSSILSEVDSQNQSKDPLKLERRMEPTFNEDGTVEWKCKVCSKVCATEHELAIHKKRHKIDDPLICPYCQRSYVDQHRYAVHVRIHTGETPFHCDLCGKGFRDDRKMKLHMARHNSGLSHKCHLCPRSFEGPKALEKHLKAHALGRYVAPKVIKRQDGTVAMALPDDPNQNKKVEGTGIVLDTPLNIPATERARELDQDSETITSSLSGQGNSDLHQDQITDRIPGSIEHMVHLPRKMEEDSASSDAGMISLSVDDLYQYSVAQTNVDSTGGHENVDIHDKLSEGAAKIVPLGMDEFMAGSDLDGLQHQETIHISEGMKVKQLTPVKLEKKPANTDSSEFPDLLDSSNSLATLNSNFDYTHYETSDDKIDQLLKNSTIKEESGLTFATLSGLDPVYPDVDLSSLTVKQESIVVAKKSVAPALDNTVPEIKSETIEDQQTNNLTELVQGTSSVPMLLAAKEEPQPIQGMDAIIPAPDTSGLTFTIQYNMPQAPEPPEVEQIKTEEKPVIDLEDDDDLDMGSNSEFPAVPEPPQPNSLKPISQIKPILEPVDPLAKDPSKDTFTLTTAAGTKIEVPTIITGGYDFDRLLCLFCERQQFKNDKTLINHLLNHFGVAPKMATCPICGLSLQKKSFARHVRLHGDVKPEVCPYCKKEFREKRSLDKHIRAIHEAERPYACEHCTESFRNQIELKNHINRHLKDYPFKCDVCSMTFQKQEALTTHYRLHTGEKPFTCPICEKRFTSEKNKRVHVLRHQGSLPHRCEVCDMTFQSRSHLLKHATSHNRKTQVISAKINTFLESFGASLGEFGLDDSYESTSNDISLHSATESGEIEDASIRLSVDNLPEPDNLEAAAAEAAFAFGGDLTDDFIKFEGNDSLDPIEKNSGFATPEPPSPMMPVISSNTGSAPSLVNGLSEEEAEKMAKAELATDIPATADGTYLCQMCNTKLGNKRSYIIHLRRHAGMLNFKCKYCTKTFQGRVKLNRHMNTHMRDGSNITPPPSTTLGPASTINPVALLPPPLSPSMPSVQMTPQMPILKEHLPMEVKPNFTFNCAMCSKVFTDKHTLQEHTKMHLIEDAKAKFSSVSSKDKKTVPIPATVTSMDAKQMKYSYTCNLCNCTFLDNERWKVHKTSHGNKTWKCKICNALLEDKNLLGNHLHEVHGVGRDEMETMGFLKAIPLVIIKAVTESPDIKQTKIKISDSGSEESEGEVEEPIELMPRHFDREDAFFTNITTLSRSNSAASLDLDTTTANITEARPSSACTDTSDTSMNASFEVSNQSEIDESNFDASTLTCKLCNKVLKNMRTFRNHKARHLGTLNHKCPDCSKCFEGRSAVNRHLISNHNRELQPHEITTNPAATAGMNIIKPTAPEIKLFKPSEMARKTFKLNEMPAKPMEAIIPDLEPVSVPSEGIMADIFEPSGMAESFPEPIHQPVPDDIPVEEPTNQIYQMMELDRGGSNSGKDQPSENLGQMPILLENHTPEIRYIVGSQLKAGDLVQPTKEPEQEETKEASLPILDVSEEKDKVEEIEQPLIILPPPIIEENFDDIEPLSTSSPRKEVAVKSLPKEMTDQSIPELEEQDAEDSEKSDLEKSLNDSKLPSKLANIEKIIPESDDSDEDKSDSDSSSSSDQPSSDSEWENFPEKKKQSEAKVQPEEITIDDDDDDNVNDKSDSSKYHDAFQSFLSKSKEEETESEIEEDPMERKRKTRQTSKLKQKQKEKEKKPIVVTSDPADDEVIIYDPLEEEIKQKESKQKQIEDLDLKDVKLSDEDSSSDEIEERKSRKDLGKEQAKHERIEADRKPRKRSPSITKSSEEEMPEIEAPSKPKEEPKSTKSQTNKVSMVAAIFRAKKKKQEEEKEEKEDVDQKLKSMATRVLLPKQSKAKKVEMSESESDREREKPDMDSQDDSNMNKEMHDETSKGRMMIPVDKLTIPEELCKMKSTGRGRGTKKFFVCQICENQFDKADKMKHHLYNDHYDDFIRCSESIPKFLAKSYTPLKSENKPTLPLEEKIAEEKEEKPVISKPSALARIFKRKGPKKLMKPRETLKSKATTEIKVSSEDEAKSSSVFDFEESHETDQSSVSKSPAHIEPNSTSNSNVLVSPKIEDFKDVIKTPTTFDSFKSAQVDIEPLRVETKLSRRNSRSPRGARISEDLVTSRVGGKSPQGQSGEKNILTPASMKLLSPGRNSMNTSVILSQKAYSSSELTSPGLSTSKPPENIQLSPRLDSVKNEMLPTEHKENLEESLETIESKGSLISKPVSLKPRDEDNNTNCEPKFGSHKNLVTFADLAMKSKAQAAKALTVKTKGKPGRKPKKVGRKKVSARVSLEQSEIEDTACLIALQASRDTDMLDEESSAIIEETQQSYKKELKELTDDANVKLEPEGIKIGANPNKNKDSDSDSDEADHPMPESLRLMLGEAMHREEEESRATRSNLHVDTIGLTSSTLDLELHALRNLVFNEILGTGTLEIDNHPENSDDEKNSEQEDKEEELSIEEDSVNEGDAIDDNLDNLDFVDEMELLDEPITELSSTERFLNLGQNMSSVAKTLASTIWHERKRLRLKRSGELRDLKEVLPMEKRAKFKPRRHDFTLELLCGNNLFDNIIIESGAVLKEVESVLYLASKTPKIVKQKKIQFKLNKSSKELGFTLRRIKSPKYMARTVTDNKLVFKRIASDELIDENKLETDAFFDPDIGILPIISEKNPDENTDTSFNSECTDSDIISPRTLTSILKKGKSPYEEKSLDLFGKTKNQKVIPQRKFKVSKVTWGPPPTKGKRTPKKAKLKESIKADKENTDTEEIPKLPEVKVPKKRGRKPKIKVENTAPPAVIDEEKKTEVVEKVKPKRGRPKSKPPVQVEVKEVEPKTEIKKNIRPPTPPISKVSEIEPQSKGLKRSRKGRPRKLTEEDVAKCQQLDIQLIEDDKSSDQTLQKIIQSESSKKFGNDFQGFSNDKGRHTNLSFKPDVKDSKNDNIFDFDDDDDDKKESTFVSHTSIRDYNLQSVVTQSKQSGVLHDGTMSKKRKIKRCQISGESGDEQQVPLKITFKAPKQAGDGEAGNKSRKSIKLRVKTQTTRDNGLKIQIQQPKTDNPLKFKVKAGSKENKKRRIKKRGSPSPRTSPDNSEHTTKMPRDIYTHDRIVLNITSPVSRGEYGESSPSPDDGTDAAPEDNSATTSPADQAVNSRKGERNSSSASSKADKNSSADSSEHSKDTSNNRDLLDKHSTGDFFEDDDNVGDDDNMSGDSSILNDNIGQFDGNDEISDDEISQLDGSYDGFYKISRHSIQNPYKKVSKYSIQSCITVLGSDNVDSSVTSYTSTAATSGPSSGSGSADPSSSIPGTGQTGQVGARQVKRDRSISDDSSEGGDHPAKKKHQCHICNKLFPNSFRLKTHFRVHTGEKPFKCEPCGQAFADRSNYVKHKQTKTHKNKVDLPRGNLSSGFHNYQHPAYRAPNSQVTTVAYHPPADTNQEVPQFEFLDSPGTFNQHDLDSHVPVDGYDTDDSLPMTFEDMDDVSLAAEYYMFSSQVDGEQDLIETDPKKVGPGTNIAVNIVNGVSGVMRQIGTEQGVIKLEPSVSGTVVINGNNSSGFSENSILARHLGMIVTKAPNDPSERTFSCDMCSAKLKNKRNFETHMKRHRGELPFKCEECPKTFQGRRDLETHKRSRHDPTKKPVVREESMDSSMSHPMLLSPVSSMPMKHKTIVLSMNSLPSALLQGFVTDNMNTVLIKQDPVMVANHKDEPPDPDTDFILQDSLPLFDNSLMESTDSAVNLSLDDLTNFAQPLGGSIGSSGCGMGQPDNSFDASMDGSASFLSGADMSTDTFDLVGDSNSESGYNRTPSIAGWLESRECEPVRSGLTINCLSDMQSENGGITSPFTPRSGSGTPSLPDEGEFPCPQCDKRFGNRRNLMSHMRRHTGDYKLFCESCGKGFFTQSKLDSHKRKHTGEKPFRCLFSTCLKRFRYKGDLSKHIKRYHPGHSQALTPVPLQDDEIAALANAQQAAKQKCLVVTSTAAGLGLVSSSSPVSTLRTVLTTGLRPNQLLLQPMQPPPYRLLPQTNNQSNPGTIIPDSDPSLDENLLNMLAADGEDDDPMLSPSATAKTLAGLSQSNTALVLPNTVFSSKPVSNQDVGVFLQSSGKSSMVQLNSNSKHVLLTSQGHNGSKQNHFVLPQSSVSYSTHPSSSSLPQTLSHTVLSHTPNTTSSQTLRSLLSSTPENLPVSQTLLLSPLNSKLPSASIPSSILTTTFSPSLCTPTSPSLGSLSSPRMSESFLPADISFTSESSRSSCGPCLSTDTVTLTLDDIMSYNQMPGPQKERLNPPSDRDSDLTSPGSVRSELDTAKSEEGDVRDLGPEKLLCQFPGCGRSFDRPNLLKRHIKLHSGECRFVCDVCKKNFESGSKLEDHYRRHTGERPFQCHVCGNKFRYKGDRTKHLKNLHGIHKSLENPSQNIHTTASTVPNGNIEMYSPTSSSQSQGPSPPSSLTDKTPFLPSITEETCSSISSFQSNPEMSDAASASGSIIGESPNKFDPLDVGLPVSQQPTVTTSPATPVSRPTVSVSLPSNGLTFSHPQETVTMSIEEVIQYAQPIADFTF